MRTAEKGPSRPGIALSVVLLAVVTISLLSALSLLEATNRWRLAVLSRQALEARIAAAHAEWWVVQPRSLSVLCTRPPVAVEETTFTRGAAVARVTLQHLGGGVVRARVVASAGRGRYGAERLLRTDSALRVGPPAGCPSAQALIPLPEREFGRLSIP